ncbi:MAG: double zinc ribbon domain-containing protein [Polyangia bacterium]
MLLQLAAQLLWPARCAACNTFVPEDRAFCESCELSVSAVEQACDGCGLPHAVDSDGKERRCHGCQASPLPFSRVWTVLAYGGATTQAVLHLKHGRRRHLAGPLGALLAPALAAAIDGGVNALCPVPLHPRRLRQRGFNQALELLRVAEKLARRPAARAALVVPDGLRRMRDTPALGRESPASRRRIVAGAFAVHRPQWVKGRRILLVDDVMTTGATLAECAGVLLKAGAAEVQVVALARVA